MLAILVPYRDRAEHLSRFVPVVTKYLTCEHRVYVIEQADTLPFNRGKLLNIGFLLAPAAVTHYALHDIDHIPINVDYSFPSCPTNLVGTPPYDSYFGGVSLFSHNDFLTCNGFSNSFWGWGAEDDDLFRRVNQCIGKWERRSGIFATLYHAHAPIVMDLYRKNCELLNARSDTRLDGVSTCKFTLLESIEGAYTHFRVTL